MCGMTHIHECVMTHWYVWHASLICLTWRSFISVSQFTDPCDVTHWYVWHDSLICVPWLIDMCAMTHWYVDHTWEMTYWYVWHLCVASDMCAITLPFICVWETYVILFSFDNLFNESCIATHWHVWHDWFSVTWLIHTCNMTHSRECHDVFMFIGKVVFICLVGSVNLVSKFQRQPCETRFQPEQVDFIGGPQEC